MRSVFQMRESPFPKSSIKTGEVKITQLWLILRPSLLLNEGRSVLTGRPY